jgi:hypothetical protein
VQQLLASVLEFPCRWAHRCSVRDVELDADLRHRPLRRPSRRTEARFRGPGPVPDAETLATGDLLAAVILAALSLRRQPKGVDVQLATGGADRARSPRQSRGTRCSCHLLVRAALGQRSKQARNPRTARLTDTSARCAVCGDQGTAVSSCLGLPLETHEAHRSRWIGGQVLTGRGRQTLNARRRNVTARTPWPVFRRARGPKLEW